MSTCIPWLRIVSLILVTEAETHLWSSGNFGVSVDNQGLPGYRDNPAPIQETLITLIISASGAVPAPIQITLIWFTDNLVPSAELHIAKPGVQWYVLHDNDKKFKSNLVQDMLFAKGVTALHFPAYSPDLNPMENLWATLARAVERYQADTIEALHDAVEAEWTSPIFAIS